MTIYLLQNDAKHNASNRTARRTLIITTIICLAFMIAEIIGEKTTLTQSIEPKRTGGWLANSLAIITDAAHLLTDVAGFLISLFALFLANMSPTRKMNYGWHRAGACFSTN